MKKLIEDSKNFWSLIIISMGLPMIPYLIIDLYFESDFSKFIGKVYIAIIGVELCFYGVWFGFIKKKISIIFRTRGVINSTTHIIPQEKRKAIIAGVFFLLLGLSLIIGVFVLI